MAKFVFIAMSLRKDSFNKKFVSNAHRIFSAKLRDQAAGADTSHTAELLSFNDYPLPVYDADLESTSGLPTGAQALAAKIAAANAIVISTPEYNGSIPGPFKNAIDWVSRVKPMPWAGKDILLMGASPGALGAVRSLLHSRQPLELCGAYVYPETMGLPKAHEAFDESGKIKDPKLEERLTDFLARFSGYLET
jgi:chromate reductase, NAD(P)H dehydrogenase (quinone)